MTVLNVPRLDAVFWDCHVPLEADLPVGVITVSGLGTTSWFHPGRIVMRRPIIRIMLAELPDVFRSEAGGAFHDARMDRHGNDWVSGFPDQDIERLIHLGVASEDAEYCLHYEQWHGYPFFRLLQF